MDYKLFKDIVEEVKKKKPILFALESDEMPSQADIDAFEKENGITFPHWNVDADYRFDISPLSFSDDHCLVFAVSNGKQVRILAASDLEYIKAESRYNLDNIKISETYISIAEFNEILSKLSV
ncbi:MAG: hypothetical protein IJ410_03000 [Oscillospiraceae bacterium]|nr:hypothetical protein [Oscillospiraceae bacterium]